jgi:hypothetical protein
MKEQYSEDLTELKWLRLFDNLLLEEINKLEATDVTCQY